VQPNLPVTLTIDALPGQSYRGVVEFIAPLPDAQSVWMNPDLKVYNTDIRMIGNTAGLRTGMSCRGEILVQEFDDTLYVPVQSVVRESGEPTVYVASGQKVERRKVAIGLDNNRMIQIEDGLRRGETVLLAPPLAADEMSVRPASERANDGAPADTGATAGPSMPAVETIATPGPSSEERPARSLEPGASSETSGGARERGSGEGGGRSRFENMTPEQREEMRKQWEERMQNMSPEERAQMQERMQRRPRGENADEGQRRPE
jgi:hypothetical protein